jgi:membrane associated rhomboid family serine protease
MSYRRYGSPGLGIVAYIIITCVVLYIAASINQNLITLFGFSPSDITRQPVHPWTIVTSIFMHAPFPNFTHILFNMVVLYFFGGFLVNLVGSRAFLVVFLAGGIAGNLFFMLLASSPFATVVGASGAIFAVEGALVVMRPKLPVFVFPIPAPVPLWAAVIGGFLLTFYASADIAWQAHLGGLIFGVLTGFFFRFREKRRFF